MTTEIISWKGKTFNEISSTIKRNIGDNGADNVIHQGIFRANPLKIYRREKGATNCNERISARMSVLNAPGGSTVNSKASECIGTKTTIDFNLTENKSERPGNSAVCFSAADNARRRCRSNGMIKKNYDVNMNNDQYYTNSSQYLEARQKKFEQNQYYLIKMGDKSIQPGANESIYNVYSSNGLSHCKRYEFLEDTSFKYTWVDGTDNTIIIKAGGYLVGEVREIIKDTLLANKHYYINRDTKVKVILIDLTFDMNSNKFKFVLKRGGNATYDETGAIWDIERDENDATVWTNPTLDKMPLIKFDNTIVSVALGFGTGIYPTELLDDQGVPHDTLNENYAAGVSPFPPYTDFLLISSSVPKILPTYKPVYYKPNNYNYNTQGAVDASERLLRLKYNTITDNASKYMNAFGVQVANALAYGVPEGGYTDKDKKGYPLNCTPKFSKYYTDGVRNCGGTIQ